MMKIHECPCGNDYDFHLNLIWEVRKAAIFGAERFVTLDPFLLENKDTFELLVQNKLKIVKPSELVNEIDKQ